MSWVVVGRSLCYPGLKKVTSLQDDDNAGHLRSTSGKQAPRLPVPFTTAFHEMTAQFWTIDDHTNSWPKYAAILYIYIYNFSRVVQDFKSSPAQVRPFECRTLQAPEPEFLVACSAEQNKPGFLKSFQNIRKLVFPAHVYFIFSTTAEKLVSSHLRAPIQFATHSHSLQTPVGLCLTFFFFQNFLAAASVAFGVASAELCWKFLAWLRHTLLRRVAAMPFCRQSCGSWQHFECQNRRHPRRMAKFNIKPRVDMT